MCSLDILREEIQALSDAELIEEAHRIRDAAPALTPELERALDGLLEQATDDLKRKRLRGRDALRTDARGRLRTFCFNMRVNAAPV